MYFLQILMLSFHLSLDPPIVSLTADFLTKIMHVFLVFPVIAPPYLIINNVKDNFFQNKVPSVK
jgi:hypothetical protein